MMISASSTPRLKATAAAVLALSLALLAATGCSSSSGPARSDDSALVKAGTPDGTCLLEYNTALVSASADPCCATVNGENSCDVTMQCNASAGDGCCLIYATDAVVGGEGCCRYASAAGPPSNLDGSDRTAQCNALLAYRR